MHQPPEHNRRPRVSDTTRAWRPGPRAWLLALFLASLLVVALPAQAEAAYDLTISSSPTVNVGTDSSGGATTFTATGSGATLNVGDLTTALDSSNAVAVLTGTTGTEAGNIAVQAAIDAPDATAELSFWPAGRIELTAGLVATAGAQMYEGPLLLGADTALTATNITLTGTVDGPYALRIMAGSALIAGRIGGYTALSGLHIDGGGATEFDGGRINTTGDQIYDTNLRLEADTVITSSLGAVTFIRPVYSLSLRNLTISSPENVTLAGPIGYGGPLGKLAVAALFTQFLTDSIVTSSDQFYYGAVTLNSDTLLASSQGKIRFASTVNGAHVLSVNADQGAAFYGPIGGVSPLTGLSAVGVGPLELNGGAVSTVGEQNYGMPVVLGADTTLTSTAGAVDLAADAQLSTHSLTIGGAGTIAGVLGDGALVKQGAGTLALSGTNSYAGGTSVTGGLVSFSALSNLGSGPVTLDGGGLQWASGNTADVSSHLAPIGSSGARFDTAGNDVLLASPLTGSGAVTKAGAGKLTLSAANAYAGPTSIAGGTLDLTGSLQGTVSIAGGATLNVSGSITGQVTVQSAGTLDCQDGTLNGGVVNDGGTAGPVPDPPTGASASPDDRRATVSFTAGAAHCYPVSYIATASPGGAHASGTASPITVDGLGNGTAYTFAVTATNPLGTSAPSESSSPVTPKGKTLTVTRSGSGSGTVTSTPAGIDCWPICWHDYDTGASVTLTATPAPDSEFGGWSGAGCTGTGSSCTITMDSDQTVTATFTSLAPVSLSPPVISGEPVQGRTLTETHGSWTHTPTSYAHQWQRCDSAGNGCQAITAATTRTYTLTAADVGKTIRVQESATNGAGTGGPVSSAATAVVKPSATKPQATSPPVISGATRVGQRLSASTGTWSGTPPLTFSYQWQRCKPACVNITAARSRYYTPSAADLGAKLRVLVTARNSAGSAQSQSRQVGPVVPSVAQIKAWLLKVLAPSGKAAKLGALLKNGGYTYSFRTLSGGRLAIAWYYLPKGSSISKPNANPKPVLVATGTTTSSTASRVKLTVRLTPNGRQLLKTKARLKLTAKGTYTSTGQRATTATTAFTLTR